MDGYRSRDPQPSIRWSSSRLVEVLGIEVSKLELSRTPGEDLTESTNLDPWGLEEPEVPTRKQTGARPRVPTHLKQTCTFVLHLGTLTIGPRAVSDSVVCHY